MKVLIIVPAYNEAKNLNHVIEHLKHTCPQYDYLIVNDGSTDGTEETCRKNGYPVINHPVNRGLTETMRTGMKYALENGYDMALQFDADGQHLPEYIECMIQCMKEKNCDIVIASRFYGTRMPVRMRTLGGKMISAAIWMTTGRYLTDPTSGMRLYRRNMIRLFAESTDYGPEPDTIAYLIRMGANVQEVKVEMKERKTGQSYLTPVNAVRYMVRVLSSILLFQWMREDRKVTEDTGTITEPHHCGIQERLGEENSEEKNLLFFR